MEKNVDISRIYKILSKEVKKYKVPVVDLIKIKTQSHFKVLVATILSARTKDETTIKVCERLFTVVKDINDFEKLSESEIEKLIYPAFQNDPAVSSSISFRAAQRYLNIRGKVLADDFIQLDSKKIPQE
mgnify:CR=1 FL=1